MVRRRSAIFLAVMFAFAGAAHAQSNFENVYGFGDSYADTNEAGDPGGIFKFVLPPGVFPPSAPLDASVTA